MKRVFIAFLLVILAFNISLARKRDKAGNISDGVYTDKEYGFSVEVPDEWDSSIKKNKYNTRLVLTKKEYDVPLQFEHVPTYTQIPKISVYADTTSLTLMQFIDSLLSDDFKSDQKKDIMAEFKLIAMDFTLKKRSPMGVGDLAGYKISAQQKYTIRVESGTGSTKGEMDGAFGGFDVVTDFFGGSIFFAKQGNQIVMLHFICEWRFFADLDPVFDEIVKTFKFNEAEG